MWEFLVGCCVGGFLIMLVILVLMYLFGMGLQGEN